MLKVVEHDVAAASGDSEGDDIAEVIELAGRSPLGLDEICRVGAREMLAIALMAERRTYLEAHADMIDATGHRLVVGNGYSAERTVKTGAGDIEIQAPRVDDRRDGHKYESVILPPYMRKSPKVSEVLPVMYLRGLSTGDFAPALADFFGSDAGLSPKTIERLTTAWQAEHDNWARRDLSGSDYVYVWADGIHFNVRLEEDRLCCQVIIGVRPDGTKELVACADGYRESTESWADVLRDLKTRGLRAPSLAIGDGALGFWAALGDVFPETRTQKCWVHKTANVVSALPDRKAAEAKALLRDIYTAQTRAEALDATNVFADALAEWPKAVAKITGDIDALFTYYDFPNAHWPHLRTTNPIESTFATVRHRQRRTKGSGTRKAALAMAYKLVDAAQTRWRRVASPELVALVRNGAVFIDGELQERPDTTNEEGTAAA